MQVILAVTFFLLYVCKLINKKIKKDLTNLLIGLFILHFIVCWDVRLKFNYGNKLNTLHR